MPSNELIARVALDFIKNLLNREKEGTLRICMLGFEDKLVQAIALAADSDKDLQKDLIVRIPSVFDPESDLPSNIRSNESIIHWRHCRLPEHKRAVLFAASQKELQRNNKSIEKITKLESDTLRPLYTSWIHQAGILDAQLDAAKRKHLEMSLQATDETKTTFTIKDFSKFVVRIKKSIVADGLPVQKAIDQALPALRLPRCAGYFDRIPEKKRGNKSEWCNIFRRLKDKTRPLLVRENDRGDDITDQISTNFEEIKDQLTPHERKTIQAFLYDDLSHDKWSQSQIAMVELDWRSISSLFAGTLKRTQPLHKRTVDFLDEEFGDELDDEEREMLSTPLPNEPSAELEEFFETHQEHLAYEKKVYSAWERYIYRNPSPYCDLFAGLLDSLHKLRERTNDDALKNREIIVSIPNSAKKSFWREKNASIVSYFATRYHGIEKFFDNQFTFNFGKLMSYYFPNVEPSLAKSKSTSFSARTIKFEMVLDPSGARAKTIFFWEMPVDAIATAMSADLLCIANSNSLHSMLPTANIARQSVSDKGRTQRIDLIDVNTIRDASHSNSGTLIAPNDENLNCAEQFCKGLEDLSNILDKQQQETIRGSFDRFAELYAQAISDWINPKGAGISSMTFCDQAEAYSFLLETLFEHADNDKAREKIWKPILRIGVADVIGGAPAAIITPWHPLRLAEIYVKAHQAAFTIKQVLHSYEESILRADLLVKQRQLELQSDYYPEVCIGFASDCPILLAAADTRFDYTLSESPLRQSGTDDYAPDIDPAIAAQVFGKVCEQYLSLLPHERANFSIVLYNSESKALPNALATELSSWIEQKNELQCDLLLTHSNLKRKREIYEQQNIAVSDNSGSSMASEAAQNFLSQLRIGFLDETKYPKVEEMREYDIVALQDVIARNAELVWKKTPNKRNPDLLGHIPFRWSRRRPVELADASTSVYLVSPMQPLIGQRYLNAIHKFIKGDNALPADVVPAREVNFKNGDTAIALKQAHSLGEWVINFDSLVDQRLLANNGIRIVRHIHDRDKERNIVVSTTSEPQLLNALLLEKLDRIDPKIVKDSEEEVIGKLINETNDLSGQIVMRAARYGDYANELLGIVLSMQLLRSSLVASSLPIGWFFLDDFASWFGQREEQIADVMAITPGIMRKKPVLKIAISEAKFVNSLNYMAQARKSAKQLRETVARITRALDPSKKRIDREMWLYRIGDFMIEGMAAFNKKIPIDWDLHRWSDEVRQDNIQILISGFSHVFVHDDDNPVDVGTPSPLKGNPYCIQEIFNKPQVANFLRAFANGTYISSQNTSNRNWFKTLSPQDNCIDKKLVSVSNKVVSKPSAQPTANGPEDIRTPAKPAVKVPQKDTHIKSKSSDSLKPSLTHTKNRWPSTELANWISDESKDSNNDDKDTDLWLKNTVVSLQRALRSYDMRAEVLGSRLTPNAALIRLRGSDELTVPMVEKRRQELLTSHAIRVINVLAAPLEIIIMVSRPKRTVLRLRDLWRQRDLPPSAPESNTSLLLGARENDGTILYLNVDDGFAGLQPHGPHTLIAGETGSGKGILVQSLLLDICASNSPASARIKMIDPKAGIDFPWLQQMPHLDGELITTQGKAIELLEDLVNEMDRRNRTLAGANAIKLAVYNKKVKAADRLPRIWVFHDELADWMLDKDYQEAVKTNISRLGVKARAAGINLVIVTQRPDKDALPMQLRANLTNRLVLKVADKRNSILVLDEPGAECLLGRGHLAAKLSSEGQIILAQVPFANEKEINELARIIASAW